MSPRSLRASVLAVAVSLAAAAPASASPRVMSVDGFVFKSTTDGRSDYVTLDVRTSGASRIRILWSGMGGGNQTVRGNRTGIEFARRGKKSFAISVRACRRGTCGRAQRFSGRFTVVETSTDPRPNSQAPDGGGSDSAGVLPQIPTVLPPVSTPSPPIGQLPASGGSVSGGG